MTPLIALVFMSLATWRVTRFWLKDSLIENARMNLEGWLSKNVTKRRHRKLLELITCPWCISVWVSAGLTALWRWQEGDGYGWFVVMILWLATAAGAMAWWRTMEDA